MHCNFRVRNKKIYWRIKNKSIYLERKTEFTTDIGTWNQNTQRFTGNSTIVAQVNAALSRLASDVDTRIAAIFSERGAAITQDDINKAFNPKAKKVEYLTEYAAAYIDTLGGKVNQRTGLKLSRVTINKQRAVLDKIVAYESEHRSRLLLSGLDSKFYSSFTGWMMDLDYSMNTIGKHLDIIKTWLREADALGHEVNPFYRSSRWQAPRERKENIYLNSDELQRMLDLELIGTEKLVRDCFMISVYSGLRYSDMSRLSDSELIDGKIKIETQKTRSVVLLPIHPVVARILNEYRDSPKGYPVPLSNQKMNEVLKVIGSKASINDVVASRITKGGARREVMLPKYELITTHTARRSFARNLYLENFSLDSLMVLMGHSKIEQTREYVGAVHQESADNLAKHWRENQN